MSKWRAKLCVCVCVYVCEVGGDGGEKAFLCARGREGLNLSKIYGGRKEEMDSWDITEPVFLMNKGWQLCNIISQSKSIPWWTWSFECLMRAIWLTTHLE